MATRTSSEAPSSKAAKAPAKRLERYRGKRDFAATPEPRGTRGASGAGELGFVVQRHRARRTHYDFRLEMDGVLASWAVPKGPTLDPDVRSLAVHVEDHPIDYRDFEGVIPAREYGAGDVIVWDRGTYEPVGTGDPVAAVSDGELHFDLTGEKLRGRFVLVRTRSDRSGREQWLLLHKHDEFAKRGWNPDDYPRSVKSGRTNEEVAAEPEAEWHSDRPPSEAEVKLNVKVQPAEESELEALDKLGNEGTWEVQGRTLKLTNLDKVLFPAKRPQRPLTKRDLIRYHVRMAPCIVPYLRDRPVNMHRFPNGVDKPGFWHKQVPKYAPDWLRRWRNPDARPGESESYAVIEDAAGLAWMANYGAVELHAWTSRIPEVREPTWALIDVDPGTETTFEQVVVLVKLFRSGLDHLGVDALPKLTGQRGVHVWIPIVAGYSFDDTRSWVEKLSRAVGATAPDLVSWTWEKKARHGLARLDYTQNAINKTLVVPYGVRAAQSAPVSMPIEWDELDDPKLRSNSWTMESAPARVAERGDLFARLLERPQRLPEI